VTPSVKRRFDFFFVQIELLITLSPRTTSLGPFRLPYSSVDTPPLAAATIPRCLPPISLVCIFLRKCLPVLLSGICGKSPFVRGTQNFFPFFPRVGRFSHFDCFALPPAFPFLFEPRDSRPQHTRTQLSTKLGLVFALGGPPPS